MSPFQDVFNQLKCHCSLSSLNDSANVVILGFSP